MLQLRFDGAYIERSQNAQCHIAFVKLEVECQGERSRTPSLVIVCFEIQSPSTALRVTLHLSDRAP